MTSIASLGLSRYTSPRDLLQQELLKEVGSSKIISGDQEALSSALDDIDAALRSDRASGSKSGPPSPEDMKAKITGLIDEEVKSGKLTSDQATELQSLFDATFSNGSGRVGGAGGHAGPPPSDEIGESDSSDNAPSIASDLSKLLQDFLKSIQDAKANAYGANGSASASASVSALLMDFQV